MSGPPPLDTRRALVRGAAAGSLVLLLGGARGASAQLGGDRVIVAAALEVEQALLRLYRGASTGAPNIDERAIARRFADQQREHVVTLSAVLGRRAASGDDAEDGGEGGFLRQAILLEEEALAAYYGAHQRLQDASLIKVGAAIMANHGQHLVVLRDAEGQDEVVPEAFATGGQ